MKTLCVKEQNRTRSETSTWLVLRVILVQSERSNHSSLVSLLHTIIKLNTPRSKALCRGKYSCLTLHYISILNQKLATQPQSLPHLSTCTQPTCSRTHLLFCASSPYMSISSSLKKYIYFPFKYPHALHSTKLWDIEYIELQRLTTLCEKTL